MVGLSASKERLRQLVEGSARQARAARDGGKLAQAWTASQAQTDDGQTRVDAGIDGVMVPMVTAPEKDKRRKQHVARRKQRETAGVGNAKPLPPRRVGTDERYKEMKIGTFYDQDKTRRHSFVSEQDGKAFGKLLGTHAALIQLEAADCALSLTDGAKWIWRAVITWLVCLSAVLLDFYHLAQHVHEAARCCLGETEAARAWAAEQLSHVKVGGACGSRGAGRGSFARSFRPPYTRLSSSGPRSARSWRPHDRCRPASDGDRRPSPPDAEVQFRHGLLGAFLMGSKEMRRAGDLDARLPATSEPPNFLLAFSFSD
ncbi:MAG TPA: hypothetical protein VGI81_13225 [Tepidisphaeraceae bacterium]